MAYNESDYLQEKGYPEGYNENFLDDIYDMDPNEEISILNDTGEEEVITVQELIDEIEENDNRVDGKVKPSSQNNSEKKEGGFLSKIKFW